MPINSSVAWLQRGCATSGLTFAQKPLARLQRLPKALRALIREAEAYDRLDRLESIFPGDREPERRAVLLRHRMAVGADCKERELIGGFRHREPFDVWPWVPGLPLPGSDRCIQERFHPHVLRRRQRLCELDQF